MILSNGFSKNCNWGVLQVTINKNKIMSTVIDYKIKLINGIDIFYRESGSPNKPTIFLLHGFPASSYQYREVLRILDDEFHLIAPDYPGFGISEFPSATVFEYSFSNLGLIMDAFVQSFELKKYSLMIQDYGAPIGFRIATAHPEKITSIINQNGNAYEEGLGKAWKGIKNLWQSNSEEARSSLLEAFTLDSIRWQYTHGTRNPETINPDNWYLDYYRLCRPGAHKVNLDLFYDYRNNVKLYPEWQDYLRNHHPPILIVWGKNDAFFPEAGALAFKNDVKNIEYHFYDTGHFALEEDAEDICEKMRAFLRKVVK